MKSEVAGSNPAPADAVSTEAAPDSSSSAPGSGGNMWTALKLLSAAALCVSAYHLNYSASQKDAVIGGGDDGSQQKVLLPTHSRRLQQKFGVNHVPSYMNKLMDDLAARKKLFEDTPPEEIKYWFEYSGPLQVRSFARSLAEMR